MKKIILVAAALALTACNQEKWRPTPGATPVIGRSVTAATPPPAGVDCDAVQVTNTSLEGRPLFTVVALPSPTTITVVDKNFTQSPNTVDRRCVTPYVLRD